MLVLAIGLLAAAMTFSFLELFVISFGAMSVMGLLCAGGSVWTAFLVSDNTGWLFVGLNAAGVIGAYVASFKYMPRSPLALKPGRVEEGGYEPVEKLDGLVGKSGVAFTVLRPGGTALIDGRKVDVVASGGMIEPNARIKVLAVEGTKVVVEREVL
jgi:membrane-bound ClpP family serine protease